MNKIVNDLYEALPSHLSFKAIHPYHLKDYSINTALVLAVVDALAQGRYDCVVVFAGIEAECNVDIHIAYLHYLPLLETYCTEHGREMHCELSDVDQNRVCSWMNILNQTTYN